MKGSTRLRRAALIGAGLLALAAGEVRGQPEPPPCPGGGTALRWEGFGRPFFAAHCSGCHDYAGAYTHVYGLRKEILGLVASGNMPPFAGVPEDAKRDLAEWIACDLPFDGPACPPEGTPLSYQGFGLDFFGARCLRCHSRAQSGPERNGAPPGLDWDDLAAVRSHAVEIREQVLKGSMPPDGPAVPAAEAERLLEWTACGAPEAPPERPFRRGDADGDGAINVTDAVRILIYLFRGGPGGGCLDAMNAAGSPRLDASDAVYLLQYLFLRGPPPPRPFAACGTDGAIGCAAFSCPPE